MLRRMRATSIALSVALLATPLTARGRTAATPCTTASPACVAWVVFGPGPARTMVYASYPLNARNEGLRRALIMVHGTNRNAGDYFRTAIAAAFLAGALEDTIVIAPRFAITADPRAADEVDWPGGGDSWRSGGISPTRPELSSFDVTDALLRTLATKTLIPNMSSVVVTGHSAGGQYATRYAMANKVHETLGLPVRYVVANPSSYVWPAAVRPLPQDDADAVAAKDGWKLTPETAVHTNFAYGPFDATAKSCPAYNNWPLGLGNRRGYTAGMSDDQLKRQLAARPTIFLVGQVDTLPLGGFDSSCGAMAQGPTRRARGEAFVKFVNEQLGATHTIQVVAECGHNNRCIYTDDAVLPIIFPKR